MTRPEPHSIMDRFDVLDLAIALAVLTIVEASLAASGSVVRRTHEHDFLE